MLTSRIASRFAKHPLYLQVRDAMAERIAAGEWKPSATIPNEGDLAREFGVSPGTMRKALDLLEVERLLTRRQGRGTFVNDQSSAELAVRYSNIREDNGAHAGNEVEILDITEGIPKRLNAGASMYARTRRSCASAACGAVIASRTCSRTWSYRYPCFPACHRLARRRTASSCWRSSMVCCWVRAKSALRLAAPRSRSPVFWK
jgi:DNA-binding transcriptional regulator YhcF (GntR family)